MNEIPALLQQAVALHKQGELGRAQAIYDEVLRAQPLNFDALHLSGALARQQGEPQRALDLIEGALVAILVTLVMVQPRTTMGGAFSMDMPPARLSRPLP